MKLPGYRITLMCDTCAVRRRCWLVGRSGDAVDVDGGPLTILAGGWERDHAGHSQMVVASPASLDVEVVE